MKTFWLGMLLVSAMAAPVFAQMGEKGEEGGEGGPEGEDLQAEYFKASDTDKDGKISYDELKKLAQEKQKALEAAGQDEEKLAAVEEKYVSVIDIYSFTLADANDDRAVTVEEVKAYLKAEEAGTEFKYSTKDIETISDFTWDTEFSRFDANSDGKLSKEEYREYMKKILEGYTEKSVRHEDPTEGPKHGPDKPHEAGEGPKDPAAEGELKKELFALYTKEGRSWTVKHTVKMSGMEDMVSYIQTDVVKVGDDYAEIKMTMLDKDKKPNTSMGDPTVKISFRVPKATGTPKEAPKVETKDGTVKVEAGEFECTVTTVETNGYRTTAWVSKKFAGLLVKSSTTGSGSETVSELVEFKE
jgi:hypothetical protein